MHPRNPYRTAPDFFSLAQDYPDLQKYLIDVPGSSNSARKTIDFRNEDAQRCLTETILLRDFGVRLTRIPVDRLCPPVPNRLNYVLWIEDIISASISSKNATSKKIHGIDIGTGPIAIYPFLACRLNEDWEMIGTELDGVSYANAIQNVGANGMQGRIQIRKSAKRGLILFPLEDNSDITGFDFTMCNPPFYSSNQEIEELSKRKQDLPSAVCTGADVEMIYTDGGEAGFVAQMIEESVRFGGRCKWYTSMLGRMCSVITVVDKFRRKSITNYAITEFVQGHTRRWAVGWSFLDGRLPDAIARMSIHQSHALASYIPLRNTLLHVLSEVDHTEADDATVTSARANLQEALDQLENVRVALRDRNEGYEDNDSYQEEFFIEADSDSWSRAARRRRRRVLQPESAAEEQFAREVNLKLRSSSDTTLVLGSALVCSIAVVCSARTTSTSTRSVTNSEVLHHVEDITEDEDEEATSRSMADEDVGGVVLRFQWVYGKDRRMFESFASHVARKVKSVQV